MQKEIIMAGKTVDEALQRAYDEMGVTSDETGFEIIQMPKKGFLGLSNHPAKVRVYLLEEQTPPEKKPQPAAREKAPPKREPQRSAPRAPREQKPVVPPREEKRPEQRPERGEPSVKTHPERPRREFSEPMQENWVETPREQHNEKTKLAISYLSDILREMGVRNAVVKAQQTPESINIMLEGEGLGVIIGRRGETLDSVQYLTSLVANRMDNEYIRISIDSGDYRKKRAETLERLAAKLARSAVKTGRSQKLEPMNPYERRIIHAAVSKVGGATSSSVGEEPMRRVVISSENPRRFESKEQGSREARPPREDNRSGFRPPREGGSRDGANRDGGGNRRFNDRPPRSPRPAQKTAPAKKIRDNEIQIPAELAPRAIAAPQPAAPKPQGQEPNAPTEMEKGGALYGKVDF